MIKAMAPVGRWWNRIRWRMIVSSLVVVCVPLSLVTSLAGSQLWKFYLRILTQDLEARAALIADSTASIVDPQSPDNPAYMTRLVQHWDETSNTRVTIIDSTGKVEASLIPSEMGQQVDPARRPGMLEALRTAQRNSAIWKSPDWDYNEAIYLNEPIYLGDRLVGVIRASYSLARIEADVAYVRGVLLALVAAFAAIVTVLTIFLANSLTRPLEQLRQGASRIAGGDLHVVVPEQGTEEVRMLANTMNHMTARLSQLESLRRQYVSDVSHELRTPLGSIRAMADTLLEHAESDPQLVRRYLTRIVAQTERLSRLAAQILDVSVTDSRAGYERKPVDIAGVVASVVQDIKPRVDQKHLSMAVEGAANETVVGDRDRLSQVFLNLLDNAIRHTAEGGRLTVRLNGDKEVVKIAVSDTGDGIPPEHLPHIFERYYRAERSRSAETGGTGLGLAIVQQIVEAHEGRVEVESTVGKGTTFTVSLPRS